MANHTIKKNIQTLLEDKTIEVDEETKKAIDKIMLLSNKKIWELVNAINQDLQVEISKIMPNHLSTGVEKWIEDIDDTAANEEERQKASEAMHALRNTYFFPACERIADKYSVPVQFLHIIEELMYIKNPLKTQVKVQ